MTFQDAIRTLRQLDEASAEDELEARHIILIAVAQEVGIDAGNESLQRWLENGCYLPTDTPASIADEWREGELS